MVEQNNTEMNTEVSVVELKTSMDSTKSTALASLTACKVQAVNPAEVNAIVSKINTSDLSTITKFGEDVALSLGRTVDGVLQNTNMDELDAVSKTMGTLTKLMKSLNMKELTEETEVKGLSKLFGGVRKQIDKILAKYTAVGDEIENIYMELKEYEREIERTNHTLDEMYVNGVEFYRSLSKYIAAGQQALSIIDDDIAKIENSENSEDIFKSTELKNARDILEQRIFDLSTAEMAAMQAIPMLKMSMYSNAVLSRKVNSAFIVTLPVFKQGVAQAILMKKQQLQSDSLKALDDVTNEMWKRNAEMMVTQGKSAMEMSYNSSIKVKTLEDVRDTILNGVEELKSLESTLKEKRKEELRQLEAMKNGTGAN